VRKKVSEPCNQNNHLGKDAKNLDGSESDTEDMKYAAEVRRTRTAIKDIREKESSNWRESDTHVQEYRCYKLYQEENCWAGTAGCWKHCKV